MHGLWEDLGDQRTVILPQIGDDDLRVVALGP